MAAPPRKRNLSSPRSKRKADAANAIAADLGTLNGAALLAKQVRSIVGDRLDVLVLCRINQASATSPLKCFTVLEKARKTSATEAPSARETPNLVLFN